MIQVLTNAVVVSFGDIPHGDISVYNQHILHLKLIQCCMSVGGGCRSHNPILFTVVRVVCCVNVPPKSAAHGLHSCAEQSWEFGLLLPLRRKGQCASRILLVPLTKMFICKDGYFPNHEKLKAQ